ncbi:nuclease-related domain-containing protein [Bacillus sp. FJAT-22090]|uniref:nuclease-related domain-containing protein n=1 Tax=Bacillus sp. FJAT-22090 TaxID=1581038 RepID=UPI00119F8A07|nr:nuclease-related domain-containing protein [Bacillus sp. FJAT-22090]
MILSILYNLVLYQKGGIYIDNQRILPKTVQVYKRLLHRIPKDQSIYFEIENKIRSAEAGYNGECYVDNFIRQVSFPKHYAILKDIHIQIAENNYLQIDTLILTKKYITILEVKNIRGKIYFQKNPDQLIREVDGVTTPFKCPEQQLKRHVRNLQVLLQVAKINIPIRSLIVLAYSKTQVVLPPQYTKVVMGCDISNKLNDYNQLPDSISTIKFQQLLNYLISHSQDFIPKPLAQTYSIAFSLIKTGLFCPNCAIKVKNRNKCPNCKTSKSLMQKQALEDWFYLVKGNISNHECVYFLELKDKYAASYLFKTLNLLPMNHFKSRYYILQKSSVSSTYDHL